MASQITCNYDCVVRISPQNSKEPKNLKQPCDTSEAAVRRAAQKLTSTVPGARVGTQNKQPVINFSGNYHQTIGQLQSAGYYSGIRAYNPLDHSGGMEFRTYGSPGFHFKVLYPDVKETHVRGRLGVSVVNKPVTATDLHIDCRNPVGAGLGDLLGHVNDFLRGHPFLRGFLGMP